MAAPVSIDDARYFGFAQPDVDFPDLADTAYAQNMLTQYNELRPARGKTSTAGDAGGLSGGSSLNNSQYYGNENSVNYSGGNSMYGGYGGAGMGGEDGHSYYYGGGGGLSPAIAMRSPMYGDMGSGGVDGSGGSLKRKKRSGRGGGADGDSDSLMGEDDVRMAGSGLLDIPEHLLAGGLAMGSGRNSSMGGRISDGKKRRLHPA